MCIDSYFFYQTPWLLFFLLHVLVWLLFRDGVYFFGESGDINDELDKVHMSDTVTTVRHCHK